MEERQQQGKVAERECVRHLNAMTARGKEAQDHGDDAKVGRSPLAGSGKPRRSDLPWEMQDPVPRRASKGTSNDIKTALQTALVVKYLGRMDT